MHQPERTWSLQEFPCRCQISIHLRAQDRCRYSHLWEIEIALEVFSLARLISYQSRTSGASRIPSDYSELVRVLELEAMGLV